MSLTGIPEFISQRPAMTLNFDKSLRQLQTCFFLLFVILLLSVSLVLTATACAEEEKKAASPLQLWPFRARCARRPLAHLLPAQSIHQRRTRAHFVRFSKGRQTRRFHHAPPQRHLQPGRTEGRLANSEHQLCR